MPEALTKMKTSEGGGGGGSSGVGGGCAEENNPYIQAVENKLRNLAKRQKRLADKEAAADGGKLTKEEAEAIAKLDEVNLLIKSFEEVKDQLRQVAGEVGRKERAEAKSRDAAAKSKEAEILAKTVAAQDLLAAVSMHKQVFLKAPSLLSVNEAKALEVARSRLFPVFKDSATNDAFASATAKAGTHLCLLWAGSSKIFVEGMSYANVADLLHRLAANPTTTEIRTPKSNSHKEAAKEVKEAKTKDGPKETGAKEKPPNRDASKSPDLKDAKPQRKKRSTKKAQSPKVEPKEESPAAPEQHQHQQPQPEMKAGAVVTPAGMAVVAGGGGLDDSLTLATFEASAPPPPTASPTAILPASNFQFFQPDALTQQPPLAMEPPANAAFPPPASIAQLLQQQQAPTYLPPNVYPSIVPNANHPSLLAQAQPPPHLLAQAQPPPPPAPHQLSPPPAAAQNAARGPPSPIPLPNSAQSFQPPNMQHPHQPPPPFRQPTTNEQSSEVAPSDRPKGLFTFNNSNAAGAGGSGEASVGSDGSGGGGGGGGSGGGSGGGVGGPGSDPVGVEGGRGSGDGGSGRSGGGGANANANGNFRRGPPPPGIFSGGPPGVQPRYPHGGVGHSHNHNQQGHQRAPKRVIQGRGFPAANAPASDASNANNDAAPPPPHRYQ